MYHQYAPFYSELWNKIRNGESLTYSWDIGMGTNFMSTRLKNIEMDKVEYVTDNGEKLLLSQIASYTKYAAGATAAEELIKLFNKYEKRSDEKTDSVADVFDKKISKVYPKG